MRRALILIDIQEGMDSPLWGARNNPQAEENAARLLAAFRVCGAPLVHVRHFSERAASPLHPDNGGTAIKSVVAPQEGEIVFSKTTNSAFIGTPLETHLRDLNVTGLVVAGLSTPQCISTIAITRRETNSWRWPMFMLGYLFALAYLAAGATYWTAVAFGLG